MIPDIETRYIIHEDKFFMYSDKVSSEKIKNIDPLLGKQIKIKVLNPLTGKFVKIAPNNSTKILKNKFRFYANGIQYECVNIIFNPLTKRNNIKFVKLQGENCDVSISEPKQIQTPYLSVTII